MAKNLILVLLVNVILASTSPIVSSVLDFNPLNWVLDETFELGQQH